MAVGDGGVRHYDAGVPSLAELGRDASGCTRCALSSGRTNVVFGVGSPDADLMFVGEGPGRDEDLQGEPFVGRSGQLLDRVLAEELAQGTDRRVAEGRAKAAAIRAARRAQGGGG